MNVWNKLNRIAAKVKISEEIKTKDLPYYAIMGREKGKGKFKAFDYSEGKFVVNVFNQTMWPDKSHVQKLVDFMNKENPEYEFKVIKRS